MALPKDQEDIYRKAMDAAKKELDSVDEKMQEEIQNARQRLAELQESKKQYRQIYEGTALLLGIEIEPEEDKELGESEEEDEDSPDSKLGKKGAKEDDESDDSEAAQAQTA